MNFKMICIDMDGTLLGKGRKISDYSKQIIKEAYKKGIEIVITTGRIYNNAAYFSELLGVKSPVIAANGAIVREKNTDNIIYSSPMKTEECIEVARFLKSKKVSFHFYTLDTIYCNSKLNKFLTKIYMKSKLQFENYKIEYKVVKENSEWEKIFKENEDQITKCIAFSLNHKKIFEIKEKLKDHNGIVYYGAGRKSVEINAQNASKGNAVKALAEYYNISPEQIMCIGDNENDISMLKYAGLAVAMENAVEDAKKVSNYITDSNKEDGVAKAIQKFILK